MKKTALQRINLLIDLFESLENTYVANELKEMKKELNNNWKNNQIKKLIK